MAGTACLQYEHTLPGTFVKRLNRFAAQVLVEGKTETVHVKNTGRLQELLVPGADVTLQKAANPARATAFDLISVWKQGLDWVNIDSLAPNLLMKRFLESQNYDRVKPEYRFGDSRFDFYMEKQGRKYLREVKGCTLALDLEAGTGLFPDAPTERGVKHLHELAEAQKAGYLCSVCFVIQMNGIHTVLPNDVTQPAFGMALEAAAHAGVEVLCCPCRVEADRIWIIGESRHPRKRLNLPKESRRNPHDGLQ